MGAILDEREREILRLRYDDKLEPRPLGERATFKRLAQRFGTTPERIRQVEARALKKILEAVKATLERPSN